MSSADLVPRLSKGMATISAMCECLRENRAWTNHDGVVFEGEALDAECQRYFEKWKALLGEYQRNRDHERREKERAPIQEQGRLGL